MVAYYNEFEPYAAAWLRNLIAKDMIAPGDVDERSILDVKNDDLKGYTQCHFFAGIGGWSLALRMAGWSDDRPVWTGSCPCQPFSTAGKRKGKEDERHLWPVWFGLIAQCSPAAIYGEQVASAIAEGWLDSIYDDLEGKGYSCGAAVLPACSVGAPHKRDRLWFVANSDHEGQSSFSKYGEVERKCGSGTMGYTEHDGRNGGSFPRSNRTAILNNQEREGGTSEFERASKSEYVADADSKRLQREFSMRNQKGRQRQNLAAIGFCNGTGLQWIGCPDGKSRPVKPGIRLLAHGVSARVGKLRAAGNAIVPQVAAEFIMSTM